MKYFLSLGSNINAEKNLEFAFEELKIPAAKSGQIWLVFSHLVSEQNREEMRRDLKSVQDHWGAPHRELHHPGVMLFGWKLEE